MRTLVCGFLLGSLCLIVPFSALGQPAPDLGLTLGLNVTTLQSPADGGLRQMAAGGLVAAWKLAAPLSLESQLLLSQKGAVIEGPDGRIRYGVGYLDMPLHLRVEGPSIGAVIPYATAGGFGGLKVFEQQRGGGEFRFPLDADPAFFHRFNAGLSGSLGGTLPIGGDRRLNLAVAYEHGLVDVAQSVDDQPYEQAPFPDTAYTRTWSIRVQFGL